MEDDDDEFDFKDMCESAGAPPTYQELPRTETPAGNVHVNIPGTIRSKQVEAMAKRLIEIYGSDAAPPSMRYAMQGRQEGRADRQSRDWFARYLRNFEGRKMVANALAARTSSRVFRDERRCGFVREDNAFMSDRDLIVHGDQAEWKLPEPPVKRERKNAMKTKTQLMNMAAMLADDIVTVKCRFSKAGQDYTYKASRTLAETLEKGDRVVATKDDHVGFTCVAVWEVEDECLLDDENQTYQWLIAKVDTAEAERLKTFDEGAAEQLRKAQRKSAKRAILKTLSDDLNEEDIQGTFALPAPNADGTA